MADPEVYRKNLDALREVSPDAARAVERQDAPPADVEFTAARSGSLTARYTDADGKTVHMHSAFDPHKEARKFAYACTPAFGKWIVFLGPGLWYGVRALKERMFHCPLCVVEPDAALLRAVLERVPLQDVLSLPGIRVITGPPEDLRAALDTHPIATDPDRNVVAFLQAAQRSPGVYRECVSLIRDAVVAAPLDLDPANAVRASTFGPVDPEQFRILVSANDRYADAVAHTFAPAGVQVKTIFDFPDTESMLAFDPGLLFVFSANLMHWPDTLTLMRGMRDRLGIPMLVWNMEDPMYFADPAQRALLMETARAADLYLTQSAQYLEVYASGGVHAEYVPTGARPDMFGQPFAPEVQAVDFSFFGFWTPWRTSFFDKLAALLPDLEHRYVTPGLPPEDYRNLIRGSRVNLTALTNCDVTAGEHWALSDRVWEIPYAGGFLLQDNRRHAHDHFAENEIAVFGNVKECAERIRHFVAHPGERTRILDAARERIRGEHLWAHRMERILELLLERELIG